MTSLLNTAAVRDVFFPPSQKNTSFRAMQRVLYEYACNGRNLVKWQYWNNRLYAEACVVCITGALLWARSRKAKTRLINLSTSLLN